MKQNVRGLNAIRANFAKYESNLYNENGYRYLCQALESLSEVFHTSTNEDDLKVASNILLTYRNKAMEAAEHRDENLSANYKAILAFSEYGFDDDQDFIRLKIDLEKEIIERSFEIYCSKRLSEMKGPERDETIEHFMAYLKANRWKAEKTAN